MGGLLEHDRPADAERVQRQDGAVHPDPAGRRGGVFRGICGGSDDRPALRAFRPDRRLDERPFLETRRDARLGRPAVARAVLDLRIGLHEEPAARALRVLRARRAVGVFQPGENRHQQGTGGLETSWLRHRHPANDGDARHPRRPNRRRLVVRPPVSRRSAARPTWRGRRRSVPCWCSPHVRCPR